MSKSHFTCTNPNMRKVAQAALDSGEWIFVNITKHNKFRHVATGHIVSFSISPSCGYAFKRLEADFKRVERNHYAR